MGNRGLSNGFPNNDASPVRARDPEEDKPENTTANAKNRMRVPNRIFRRLCGDAMRSSEKCTELPFK
jgi:hypothetical protein